MRTLHQFEQQNPNFDGPGMIDNFRLWGSSRCRQMGRHLSDGGWQSNMAAILLPATPLSQRAEPSPLWCGTFPARLIRRGTTRITRVGCGKAKRGCASRIPAERLKTQSQVVLLNLALTASAILACGSHLESQALVWRVILIDRSLEIALQLALVLGSIAAALCGVARAAVLPELGRRVDLAERSVRYGEGDPELADPLRRDAEG